MFKSIIGYFIQGLLYVMPVAATVYVIFYSLNYIDSIFNLPYPGVGIVVLFLGLTGIGLLGSYFIQLPLFNYFDKQLERAPLVKVIYSSVKDLMKAFVGKKKSFNKPVMVKLYENSEIRRMGFITDEAVDMLHDQSKLITVYLPHSFAISGQLFLVPGDYIKIIDHKPAEVMKYIVAGGVTKVD